MRKHRYYLSLSLAGFVLLSALMGAAQAERQPRSLSKDEVERITKALPSQATAKPRKPRRVLVFCRCEGYYHSVIPVANTAFEKMGEKTGAFEAVIGDDMALFEPESLKAFDAVLFNNTTRLKFENPRHREALMEFVKGGKGIIGAHAATDNFYNWPEAAEMMGGLFDGHPWGAGGTWAVKIDEPAHPLNKAFSGKGFLIRDEIYQVKSPYSRDAQRVLLSLDMTNPRNLEVEGRHREDNDYAISWIRPFGQGRVFYCSLGHNDEVFMNEAVLQHYLDGIQFALGDLKADAAPLDQKTKESNSHSNHGHDETEDPYQKIFQYDFGQSRLALSAIEEEIRKASPRQRRAIESRLLKALKSPEATFACKQFVCRMLRRVGTSKSVRELARLLDDARLSHMARYALERTAGSKVDAVFRAALRKVHGDRKIGVINTLGQRGDRRAVRELTRLMKSEQEAVSRAAIRALGRIGGVRAAKALARAEVTPSLEQDLADARLVCADQMLTQGEGPEALAIYRELSEEGYPVVTRIAAYRGMVRAEKEGAAPIVLALLKDDHEDLQRAAGQLVAELPRPELTQAFAEALAPIPAAGRVVLLDALAARGDKAAAAAVAQVAAPDEAVRVAAIRALGNLGGASDVELLVRAMGAREMREAAGSSLRVLSGEGVNEAIIACVEHPEVAGEVHIALIEILVARHASEAVPALLTWAGEADESVACESMKGLAVLAEEKELPALLDLLLAVQAERVREEAVKTVVAVSQKIPEENRRAQAARAMLPGVPDTAQRCALLSVLGRLATPEALPPLQKALADENEEVQKTAIRALAEWPDAAPLEDMYAIAKSSTNLSHRILALRGYAHLLTLARERSVEDLVSLYEEALELAQRPEEKLLLLSGLGDVRHPRVLDLLEAYLEDEAFETEAQVAAQKVERLLGVPFHATASNAPDDAQQAIDGDSKTRWTTRHAQESGQWFTADLGYETEIRGVILNAGSEGDDYPRGYEVFLSLDGENWAAPVAAGAGTEKVFDIEFESQKAQYVKIILTAAHGGHWWSISEMRVKGLYSPDEDQDDSVDE